MPQNLEYGETEKRLMMYENGVSPNFTLQSDR